MNSCPDIELLLTEYAAGELPEDTAREVADHLRLYGDMHRYIPALAHLDGFRVTEMPVRHRARRHGVTKYGWDRFLNGPRRRTGLYREKTMPLPFSRFSTPHDKNPYQADEDSCHHGSGNTPFHFIIGSDSLSEVKFVFCVFPVV